MVLFMTSAEMKEKFEKDGWSNVDFRELTQEEATEKGYQFALNTSKKYFVMVDNGNVYDENGKVAMYNIRCCR